MATEKLTTPATGHTNAWIAQTWISFIVSIAATTVGIIYMPANIWLRGYLGMGLMFSVGSTISLSKTLRDQEEAKRMISRIDQAKLERLLADYDPFKQ